jgi:hypothetical protein
MDARGRADTRAGMQADSAAAAAKEDELLDLTFDERARPSTCHTPSVPAFAGPQACPARRPQPWRMSRA